MKVATWDDVRRLKRERAVLIQHVVSGRGWACPNCGRAHAPDVKTCPEEARRNGLKPAKQAAIRL